MKTKSSTLLLFLVAALLASTAHAGTVNISLVPVGDPGNVADPLTGYGNVPYTYSMGEFDVTIGQYCQFLNAVAATDTYGLYNPGMAPGNVLPSAFATLGIAQSGSSGNYSYSVAGSYSQAANCPIFDVTWGDSARFVNWLANGQPTGSEGTATTETGTYTLDGATGTAALMAVTRNPGSTWVLPNVNEWYKSAYYSGGGTNSTYWIYPTQSNAIPSNVLSAIGTNNANFVSSVIEPPSYGATDPVNYLTYVGAFAASPGPYGTYDQGGDVWQWLETAVGTSSRETRGGCYAGASAGLESSLYSDPLPTGSSASIGFRVAFVPEPGTIVLLLVGTVSSLVYIQFRRAR
jgi:formylglycine-generating enzyme required for sulfatase activity